MIAGINYERGGAYSICHIEYLSEEIKELIRKHLTSIGLGSYIADHPGKSLFSYKATLKSFIDRYQSKPEETKMGMVAEFLSHIFITELFDEFCIASPFFNLEEKSIRKGFDLLLYKQVDNTVWITEVKSGQLHKYKDHDQTTNDLLSTAKADLNSRLNEQEMTYWMNAINSVRSALSDKSTFKKALEEILINEGSAAAEGKATSKDKCVVLVANLYAPLTTKISLETAKVFWEKVNKEQVFSQTVVFCLQKQTYSQLEVFFKAEVIGA